jgi:hypothetical protein
VGTQFQYIDKGAPLFKLKLQLHSSVYSQNPALARFAACAGLPAWPPGFADVRPLPDDAWGRTCTV